MDRTQLFDLMGELKLYGMKAAFDEIMTTAVKRQHEPQRIVGDLLNAEISEKSRRAPSATTSPSPCCRSPRTSKTFVFEGTPINETLVNDLALAASSLSSGIPCCRRDRDRQTHLAIAIARSCIRAGARGRFYNVVDLVNRLESAIKGAPPSRVDAEGDCFRVPQACAELRARRTNGQGPTRANFKSFVASATLRRSRIEGRTGKTARSARIKTVRLSSSRPPGASATMNSCDSDNSCTDVATSSCVEAVRTTSFGSASSAHAELERCLSVSSKATLLPWSKSHTARWTASVDFPTPPLLFANAISMKPE